MKVTSYMPPETVAELDELRADLLREGERVDRGMVLRAAIAVAREHHGDWTNAILREAS